MGEVTRVEDKAEQTQLAERSNGALSWANALTISNDEELAQADAIQCRNEEFLQNVVEAFFRPKIDRWHQGHKAELESYNGVANPLKEAKRIVKGKMGVFQMEQEALRRAEQIKAEQAARKEADDQRLREAEELEAHGRSADAELVLAQPEGAPVVAAVPPPPKVKTRLATRWAFEVHTPALVPRELCVPSDKLIRDRLRRTNDSAIPGVRAWKERS